MWRSWRKCGIHEGNFILHFNAVILNRNCTFVVNFYFEMNLLKIWIHHNYWEQLIHAHVSILYYVWLSLFTQFIRLKSFTHTHTLHVLVNQGLKVKRVIKSYESWDPIEYLLRCIFNKLLKIKFSVSHLTAVKTMNHTHPICPDLVHLMFNDHCLLFPLMKGDLSSEILCTQS